MRFVPAGAVEKKTAETPRPRLSATATTGGPLLPPLHAPAPSSLHPRTGEETSGPLGRTRSLWLLLAAPRRSLQLSLLWWRCLVLLPRRPVAPLQMGACPCGTPPPANRTPRNECETSTSPRRVLRAPTARPACSCGPAPASTCGASRGCKRGMASTDRRCRSWLGLSLATTGPRERAAREKKHAATIERMLARCHALLLVMRLGRLTMCGRAVTSHSAQSGPVHCTESQTQHAPRLRRQRCHWRWSRHGPYERRPLPQSTAPQLACTVLHVARHAMLRKQTWHRPHRARSQLDAQTSSC